MKQLLQTTLFVTIITLCVVTIGYFAKGSSSFKKGLESHLLRNN